MRVDQLPPVSYHVTDAECWPSIDQSGLLTAASIVRRWGVTGEEADRLLSEVRPKPGVALVDEDMGTAWLRDQGRMTAAGLEKCLADGMTVAQWCALLNSQVYFFPKLEAAREFAASKDYCDRPQVILRLRTESLVASYGSLVKVASINSGSTAYRPASRGRATFQDVGRFPGTTSNVKEVIVRADITDLHTHLIQVDEVPVPGA